MPITIRSNQLNVKNNGSYVNLDAVADATTEQRVQQINTIANTVEASIADKHAAALASISNISELEGMIGEVFDTTSDYLAGEYVIQNVNDENKLFKFIVDHEAGAWDTSEVAEVIISNELISLIARLGSGTTADASLHLGFYLDENGDLCQVDDDD